MISVGSRDGRKGLGLGFDAEAEMEETELEEGEACSYQNDDYSTIDPDVALSYIDEKLQDVLGHFQKEFEGGVSAENLGSKFGGYGSFLPTHQHSPVRSHPRTPPKVHNTSTPRSPNTLHLEGGRHNSIVPSSASLLVRHAQASATAASLPLLRASVSNSAERYVGVSSALCVEVSTSGCELGKDNAQPSDQKTLKVRIKVGSDDLSTRKSAEIYSGLGLDFSPASSLDDILTDSEGFTRGHHDGPDESPTSILQIMTSFPVHGNLLLSPLPGDLFYLTEKERHQGESKPRFLQKGGQQSSNGSNARGDEKLIGGRKTPSFEKNAYSIELKNLNGEDAQNRNGILLKKETDIETLDCEELVASALKLPLLSNSSSHVVNSANSTSRRVDNSKVANKVKEESLPDLAKEETLEAVSTQEIGLVEKHSGKSASAGKVWEEGKANFNGDILIYPKKDGNVKGQMVDLSAKADLNVSKGRNAEPFDPLEQKVTKGWQDPKANFNDDILIYPKKDGIVKGEKVDVSAKADLNVFKGRNAEPFDPLEQKASKKATSREEDDLQLAFEKENSSSGAKTKAKGSQSHSGQGAEVPKDRSRMDSFLPKNRKSTHANYYLPKSGLEDSKLQKDNGKARNRYRDFFGDIELDQGDNDVDSAETPSRGRPMDVVTVEKRTLASNGVSKDMLNGKKMDKPPTSEPYSKAALNAAPIIGNGSISDAAPGTLGPLVKEYWVCCDKCQKWRLLPLGTNPDSLPEKWLCSMLNWLPGMNRCSISQEETTKEVIARYQVSAPENQNNKHGHPDDVLPELSMADASCFDHNRQNIGFHSMPSGGKKKNGIKDVSAAVGQVAPAQVSDSSKKNLQAAVKSRSSNVVKHAPLVNEAEPMHLSRSSAVEKHRHNKREKNKALKQYSDGGETRSSNIKSKRGNDQDCFRNSKKIKIDGMHCADEDWIPDHDELGERVGPGSSQYPSGKDRHRYNDHSSRDKCEANNSSKGPCINPKDQVLATSDDGCQRMEKLDDKDVVRKRKINESHDTHVYTTSLLSGHQVHDKRDLLEQTSENIHRKEKKARVSKSEGKKTSMSKRSGGASQKGRSTKDQLLGPDRESSLSQRSLDATDSLRRDLRSAQPSQAATSSSSKVSGSHKSKTNMQEAKGSPVESVSSSPLRFSNPDKSTSTRRSLEGKYNFGGAGLFATGTSRRCSDGEDDRGTNRSGTVRKDETLFSNRGSLESFMLDFQERDMGRLADSEAKKQIVQCPEFVNGQFSNGDTDTLGNGTRYPCKPQASNQHCYEERGNDKEYRANMSQPRKSGKGSSSRSKHKNGSFKSELDKGKVKISDSCNESIDHIPCNEENSRAGKNRVQEKLGVNSDEVEKNAMDKKEPAGEVETEISKRESQTKFVGVDSLDDKVDALSSQDPNLNMRLDRDERSSKRYLSDKTDQAEVSRRGKSHLLPPAGRVYSETVTHSLDLNPGSQKENRGNNVIIDASEGGDALKAPKQIYKSENQNGNQLITSRNPTVNGHRVRDVDAPSPVRRDSSNQATNAVKEAKDLKHLADRFKNSGSSAESASLYFQAALKFLHGASLFESSNGEGAKQSEMIQSMQIYSSTAKLCEFCAHEYEKAKDMAAAALAYKCTEIAYMRVVYSSRTIASRDRHELQTALQIHPPGESPSSSASDVDNLNHPATLDKVPLAKGVSSPQVAGSHHIAARNRPSFVRLLNFAQDVNSAMEASRKSRMAFLAANLRKEEAQYREGITSVKMALDFNFQDVEGLLHLVRLAMEAIGR